VASLALSAWCSGFAALALQLVWGRELALTLGGSQFAAATVLTAFMLGLGVGSGIGGRLADRARRPALLVAALEVGLAAFGPALSLGLLALPGAAAGMLPAAASATSAAFLAPRLALAVLLLLVPTTLMGATYPVLARAAGSSLPDLHRALPVLYAANTLGGVAGAAAAGFGLLPGGGIPLAAGAAAAANLVAAAMAAHAHRQTLTLPRQGPRTMALDREGAASMRWVLLAAASLSGALVLGAEALWHRALMLVLANSTATLSLLLALTLTGLGLGAALTTPLARRSSPLLSWGKLQLTAAAVIATQALLLPHLPSLVRAMRPDQGWGRVLVPPLVTGGALILPATLLLGAAWPLLLVAATPRVDDGGRRVGAMGVVNSVGAAVGAAAAGFGLLPALGCGRSLLVLASLHAGLALAALARSRRRLAAAALAVGVAAATAAVSASKATRVLLPSMVGDEAPAGRLLEYRETPAGTVVVTEDPTTGVRSMFVDNNAAIGTTYDALKIVRMLGLVPALLHPAPERVLVIGLGAGVTTATVAASPGVQQVDVAEIVPGVVEASTLFEALNHRVTADPRVRTLVNDGRNHLLLTDQTYDVITCDPIHPLYGSAPLYSRDFFRLCRQRLRPGGLVCQYLPLHRMPSEELRRAIATFQAELGETWVLFGLRHAMLVGSERPIALDWRQWLERLQAHPLQTDLADSNLARPAQVAALLLLDPPACRLVGRGRPSTDLFPRLEFLAPAAYRPGLWEANAKLLVEAYRSPVARIQGLPPELVPHLLRLVAGKRLLLFSLLRRDASDMEGAVGFLRQALQVAGDDPEITRFAYQLAAETGAR